MTTKKKNKLEVLVEDSPNFLAITGDHWTSTGNHSYLGVTGHFIDGEWNLNSFALTVMKTETRHIADECAEQFLEKRASQLQDVLIRWNSTLATVSRLLHNQEAVQAMLDQQNNHRLVMRFDWSSGETAEAEGPA